MDALDQRQPRQRHSAYMGWVAQLCCVACMVAGKFNRQVQVAHLRAGSLEHGKRPTGMQEKPDDVWVTPLCMPHHTGDVRAARRSQHSMSEVEFWEGIGIDPFDLCLALKAAYDAGQSGLTVIAAFVAEGKRKRT